MVHPRPGAGHPHPALPAAPRPIPAQAGQAGVERMVRLPFNLNVPSQHAGVVGHAIKQGIDVNGAHRFVGLQTAQVVQRGINHGGHAFQICGHLIAQGFVVNQFGTQAQAC